MVKWNFFLILSTSLLIQLITLTSVHAETKEYVIFDFRKTLPLDNKQPILRDYYINMGTDQGVTAGSVVNVIRRTPVIDIYRNKTQGDLLIGIGKLKIIHAEKTMSVGRVITETDPRKIPVVQFEKIMLGDRVELAGSAPDEVAMNSSEGNSGLKNEPQEDLEDKPAPAKREVAVVKKPAPKQAKVLPKKIPKPAVETAKPVSKNDIVVEGRN